MTKPISYSVRLKAMVCLGPYHCWSDGGGHEHGLFTNATYVSLTVLLKLVPNATAEPTIPPRLKIVQKIEMNMPF
jgi:hypothetical protein